MTDQATPATASPADESSHKRRYRRFIAGESVLLILTVAAFLGLRAFRIHVQGSVHAIVFVLGILGVWHIVAVPVCILYLIGKPVVMTLSPLIPSAESRAFRRQLRERPALSDDEFHARFYAGSGIPRDIPARVRRCLLVIDPLVDRSIPSDFLYLLDDELDYADVLSVVGREFGFHFTMAEQEGVDGTLDNLIRLIHTRTGQRPEGAL